jgi:hypothetical protein
MMEVRQKSWEQTFRSAPIGILAISALLGVAGLGLVGGGIYWAARGAAGWYAIATAFAVGPLMLYVAVRLIQFARWTWMVLITLLVLLFLSSIVRALTERGPPVAPLAEMVVELGCLAYLIRPHVRRQYLVS